MSLWEYGVDRMILEEMIRIDPQDEYRLGDDQCCLNYPERFPTVEFDLAATADLCRIADGMRARLGYKPMLGDGSNDDDEIDLDGWYNFTIGLNGFSSTKVDASIMFVVVNSDSEDNERTYEIDLCEGEQELIYRLLDRQCRAYFGKGCDDLLEEARQAMEEDM